MKKKKLTRVLSSVMLAATLTVTTSVSAFAKNNDINSFIYNLTYDNQSILTREGEQIKNPPATESMIQNGKFTVLRRELKNIENHSADISVMDSNGANIYAGAILKADQNLLDNNPTIVSAARAPLTLSINLPGMKDGDSHTVVQSPTNSGVREGVNKLLATWNEKYASDYQNTPAEFQYSETMAYSMSQLKTKFGSSFEKIAVPLNLNFDMINSGERQVQIVNFKQIYYTVGIDMPENPQDFFAEQVSADDLIKKNISNEHPPVYVSNVAYGRSMYIKLETDSKSNKVQSAFNAVIKGVDVSGNAEYENILKNTSFTAVILGGDAGAASKVVSGKVEDLKQLIQEGARYGKLSPGVPISYTTNFLKDNAPATISSFSQYVQTTATSYENSFLTLDHSGAYVAQFEVEWDEVNYDESGKEVLTHKVWDKSGHSLTAHWRETIQIPGNARNLHVLARECTGLAWEWWRTVYNQYNIPLTGNRTITIWGTTLYPQVSNDVK